MTDTTGPAADATMRSLVARWLTLTGTSLAEAERPQADQIALWFRELVDGLGLTAAQADDLEAGFRNTLVAGAATTSMLVRELTAATGVEATETLLALADKYGFDGRVDE